MAITINGTTGIAGVDGSAGTPAVQGADTNTGMFFPAADTIAFAEGGAEIARFDSSGNLGLGTSSPSGKLNVISGSVAQLIIGFNATSASYLDSDAIVFRNAATTEAGRFTSTGLFQFNSGYGSSATAYGCRAWVAFNGTGTVAIRASGNVSSISDFGTGDYAANFSTNMPDTNYASVGASVKSSGGPSGSNSGIVTMGEVPAVGSQGVGVLTADGTAIDRAYVYAAFFR